jgi:nicotinate-nucleotide adenylyltransferase
MRIAFFGGTFDPVHRAHLSVARVAILDFRLDRVLFAPVGRQPLKVKTAEAPYAARVAMAKLACATSEFADMLEVSEIDAPKPDAQPNYTVDTLAELARLHPGSDLFAISGADSFLTMRSWREPEFLLQLAEWIVVSRPGFELGQLASLGLTPEQKNRVHLLSSVHEDVSASELRRRLRAGEDCAGWVPRSVLEYIRAHGLYGSPA